MAVTLDERPIFVTGSERSGTTLIMTILGCHPRIAVPEVTWYYPRFRPYLFTYGDLSNDRNFQTLANEMAYGLRKQFFGMDVNPATFGDEIAARAKETEQGFAGLFAAMLGRYAEDAGKPRWGEKTPYNLFYIEQILEDFPNAQIVFITRDGRDASAEFLDSSFGPTNIYCAAELWHMGQDAVRPWRERLPDGQWYDIKYEDFVREPVSEIKRLCAFLGEDYDDSLLDFHLTPTAQGRGRTKDNAALAHPISDKYIGRYKDELSIRDQRITAWVAGDSLRALGYDEVLEPLELTPDAVAFNEEMDGRYRAATLEAPGGWIVMESYNDWLLDQREARRQAGIWSAIPDPAPFPLGSKYEETLTGMRAHRKWKQHFAIKRDYAATKSVL
ncbi:MAG: sulfotransferase [Silicimonas sp.]|nr:sulfotransferase [Silicimonas sp.]